MKRQKIQNTTLNTEIPSAPAEGVSSGWRMREMTAEQLEAAPEEVSFLFLMMKTKQPVSAKKLKDAILAHRKYFIGPRPQRQVKMVKYSDVVKRLLKPVKKF